MTTESATSVFNRIDHFITELFKQMQDSGSNLLDSVKQAEPVKSIDEMLKANNGKIQPILECLQATGNTLHENVRQHPEMAAIGTALTLWRIKKEWWPRAILNALSLRRVFSGNAGLFSKSVIAFEGRDAGISVAGYIEDAAQEVVTGLSRYSEEDVNAVVETVRKKYRPGNTVAIDQEDWGLKKAEMTEIRTRLAKSGFTDVRFTKGSDEESIVRTTGALTGLGFAYVLAGKVSDSMRAPTTITPTPPPPSASQPLTPTAMV